MKNRDRKYKVSGGRLAAAISMWLFAVITSSDVFPIILTLPTFILIAYRMAITRSPGFIPADMLWLCMLLFFVVSPIQNIEGHSFKIGSVRGIEYATYEFVLAEMIVFLSLACFTLGANTGLHAGMMSAGRDAFTYSPVTYRQAMILAAVCVTSFGLYVAFSGGIANVLLPRLEKTRDDVSILSPFFLAGMTSACLLLASLVRDVLKSKVSDPLLPCLLFIGSAILLAASVNPLNAARFFNLATWLPIVFVLAGGVVAFRWIYLLILGGVFIAMPLMSISSRGGVEALRSFSDTDYATDIFMLKDMDVFDTLVHAAAVTHTDRLYWGDNILAIILFFVPRAWWPDKPMVGGLVIGGDLHANYWAGTDNLSFFPGGDLYMDFWFPGVILGATLAGAAWKTLMQSKLVALQAFNMGAIVVIGSLPILIRGPMGAVIGYPLCLLVVTTILIVSLRLRVCAPRVAVLSRNY